MKCRMSQTSAASSCGLQLDSPPVVQPLVLDGLCVHPNSHAQQLAQMQMLQAVMHALVDSLRL